MTTVLVFEGTECIEYKQFRSWNVARAVVEDKIERARDQEGIEFQQVLDWPTQWESTDGRMAICMSEPLFN